ncbi:hypothetical protein LTR67_010607 [Exophiala xenobiotica]
MQNRQQEEAVHRSSPQRRFTDAPPIQRSQLAPDPEAVTARQGETILETIHADSHAGINPQDVDLDVRYWVKLAEGTGVPPVSAPTAAHGSVQSSAMMDVEHPSQLGTGNLQREQPHSNLDTGKIHITGRVTQQLSSRQGKMRVAEDGRAHYYGATSNLHIFHSGLSALYQPHIRNVRTHGNTAIEQLGLEWEGDATHEEHVLKLFFAWHNPLMHVVDKAMFLQGQKLYEAQGIDQCYSPALANAIFAVGAAYSNSSPSTLPPDPGEFFASRSKAYLDIEMDSPSIATLQALLILSFHEAAQTRDARGWLYSGMAVQLMSDLGLHLSPDQVPDCTGDVAKLRKNLFWAVNSVDTFWSLYSGRQGLMKNYRHNVSKPTPARNYQWDYYTDETRRLAVVPHSDVETSVVGAVHVYLATLALKLATISDVLYSGRMDPLEKVVPFVNDMGLELQGWKTSLPLALAVEPDTRQEPGYLPTILELHAQYYEAIILLYRPFIAPKQLESSFQNPAMTSADARKRCAEAATEICRLVIMYRRSYGLRRTHIRLVQSVFTASLIHAYHGCLFTGAEGREAQRSLLTCMQALGEMGQTFKSASRALEILSSLRHKWQTESAEEGTGQLEKSQQAQHPLSFGEWRLWPSDSM